MRSTSSDMPTTEPLLRPAEAADLDEIVALYLEARRDATERGIMPPPAHPAGEIHDWLGARMLRDEVWVAEVESRVAAYTRFTRTWLDDLYVDPAAQRGGLGGMLLNLVQALRPGGFGLWVFESNRPAQAFYTAHGLMVTRRTDGSGNEERAPDLLMEWPGVEPT